MKCKMMTIRDMCDLYGVTPRTLRFYEQKELLFPLREGQRRLYSRRDRARLKLILRGKRFGFSLEDIRQLLDLYHAGDAQQHQLDQTYRIARARLDEMVARRDELNAAIDDLREQLKWGERMLSAISMTQTARNQNAEPTGVAKGEEDAQLHSPSRGTPVHSA